MEKDREKILKQDLKRIMADIEKNKKLSKKKGVVFYARNEFEIIHALMSAKSPLWSWYSHYSYRAPGSDGYFEMNLYEPATGSVSSMSRCTLFFGSTVFIDDAGSALNARCRNWPVLTSDKVYLVPGESEVVRFEFTVPQDALLGNNYLGHLINWKDNLSYYGFSEVYFREFFQQKIQ